jgi:tetratricopeptide (TPR) repeat protein
MTGKVWIAALAAAVMSTSQAQQKQGRIDVQRYSIDAEVNTRTQSLAAKAQVRFVALDDGVSTATFELNNALNLSRVTDGSGRQIPASRAQDFSVRVTLPEPLMRGKDATLTFEYDGQLTGKEESPVFGIKFASIQTDHAYLMYPARWFPVHDYTIDRFSAEMRITVPAGMKVIASGIESPAQSSGDKVTTKFDFAQMSFPGSIAIVKGDPVKTSAEGVQTALYFRESKAMATAYGEEIGKVMSYLISIYGLPPIGNLIAIETEAGCPNGYSAPGLLFFSPKGIGRQPNQRLITNQVSRQWWGTLVSPVTRDHIWITNGFARYSEMLYLEHLNGPGALENETRDAYVEALTVDNPPVGQAGRLEDYSPEFWAVTASKGSAVLNMLRSAMGDDKFSKLAKAIPDQFAWKSISTDDLEKVASDINGQSMRYFFQQWIQSSGAPEFKMEYTVFRTQKGFRIMGKVTQDLDLFRMPVDLKIETEGNPEEKKIEVVGTTSEFTVDTFGKPKKLELDPANKVLRASNQMRIAVAIRRGEQFAEVGDFGEALKEYQKALEVTRNSSLAHYRVGEVFLFQNNYQSAANEFREALNGDLEPKWTEVWSHINLGKIFDMTSQRERAVNEYNLAIRTKDNTQGAQGEAAKYLKAPYEKPRSGT